MFTPLINAKTNSQKPYCMAPKPTSPDARPRSGRYSATFEAGERSDNCTLAHDDGAFTPPVTTATSSTIGYVSNSKLSSVEAVPEVNFTGGCNKFTSQPTVAPGPVMASTRLRWRCSLARCDDDDILYRQLVFLTPIADLEQSNLDIGTVRFKLQAAL